MEKQKRKIEVFTAGCIVCTSTVEMVKSLASPECDVVVYNLSEPSESKIAQEKVEGYGIKSLPAIAVDGTLLSHYMNREVSDSELSDACIGLTSATTPYSLN